MKRLSVAVALVVLVLGEPLFAQGTGGDAGPATIVIVHGAWGGGMGVQGGGPAVVCAGGTSCTGRR